MATKLLINGIAGAGKTELLRSLGKETFVVSRDAKEFSLSIPHMLVDTYYDMTTLLFGGEVTVDGEKTRVEGVSEKIDKYHEVMGSYPEIVVIDSVSQIFMDVIDKASQTPNVYGSQGQEVTKEMAMLTKYIHEHLELNGVTVVLLNHVIMEKADGKETGDYISFGSGKFLDKGGFYSTTNESVTISPKGSNRIVYLRSTGKQARTMVPELPDEMYVENTVDPSKSKKLKEGETYFVLKEHIDMLLSKQNDVQEFRI